MKTIFLSLMLASTFLSGCCSKKTADAKTTEKKTVALYGTNWELEYISGPRITFEGLYPDEKPTLVLKSEENRFGGNSSCNAFSGSYTMKGSNIHFGQAIKTMRFCEGGGETTFLNTLGKVNKFEIDSDGKLVLSLDDVPMMRFKPQS
ncbi:MAG: META domain-containing protein [Flavobacterium sp.]